MKTSSWHFDPAAEEQASLWAARLDGSVLSAADRVALDAWLAADPLHRTMLSAYCQLSADLEQQLPLMEGIRETPAEPQPISQSAQSRPWSRWPAWAGVMLTAAAAVVLGVRLLGPRTEVRSAATPAAQRQELALSDGSRVLLSARTDLVVELGRTARQVRLAAGEAFFDVSRDPARPFLVETPAGSIRVTGTHFDVRAESASALVVTVAEGSVLVRPAAAAGAAPSPVSLGSGDQLTTGPHGAEVHQLTRAEVEDALAWRQGAEWQSKHTPMPR